MRSARQLLAIIAGRVTLQVIRSLRLGGGTALPGVIALGIAPNLLEALGREMPAGAIVVAGTNGKTTTARLTAAAFAHAGFTVIHNRSGSNLPRGIAAAFLEASTWLGQPAGEVAVLEVDEFALPVLVRSIQPRLLLLLNLFRDQLDRYGELTTIAQEWQGALATLPLETILIINADDPLLASLTEPYESRRWAFGLAAPEIALPELPHAADWRTCPRCGALLHYRAVYLAHLGDYSCLSCGFARPNLSVEGVKVSAGERGLMLTVRWGGRCSTLSSQLRGVYNAYNLLAAFTTGLAGGFLPEQLAKTLEMVPAAFGRQEQVRVAGHDVTLVLIKNPTGFNEAVRLLLSPPCQQPILIIINDRDADGRDVSWLWDVDLEPLGRLKVPISTAGTRSAEMALRLSYAGIQPMACFTGVTQGFEQWLATLPPGSGGWVLASYTAMLELRKELARRGAATTFWER